MTETVNFEVSLKAASVEETAYLTQKERVRPLVLCSWLYLKWYKDVHEVLARGHRMTLSRTTWTSEGPRRRYDWLCELGCLEKIEALEISARTYGVLSLQMEQKIHLNACAPIFLLPALSIPSSGPCIAPCWSVF